MPDGSSPWHMMFSILCTIKSGSSDDRKNFLSEAVKDWTIFSWYSDRCCQEQQLTGGQYRSTAVYLSIVAKSQGTFTFSSGSPNRQMMNTNTFHAKYEDASGV